MRKRESKVVLHFIDVRKHQGAIDWQQAAAGLDDVIIRCGNRGYGSDGVMQADSHWRQNIEGAVAAGIPRIGVYFFSQAVTIAEAEEEVSFIQKLLAPYQGQVNFPVYWDTEKSAINPNGRADRLTCRERTNIGKAFCAGISRLGYQAGIYASLSFLDEGLYKEELKDYTWWVAAYRNSRPELAADAWQYTSSGNHPGINGNVDKSYFYTDFCKIDDGWYHAGDSWYWYEEGKAVRNAWRHIGGEGRIFWYYFGADGVMLKGTQRITISMKLPLVDCLKAHWWLRMRKGK